MSTFRPRFKCLSDHSTQYIVDAINHGLEKKNSAGFVGSVLLNHVHLKFPVDRRHFWSPHLDISLEEIEEGKTMIRFLLGPSPGVWTLFVFFYSIFGIGAIGGLMVWLSQLTLQSGNWGLWLMIVSSVLLVIMHLVSGQGKRLAREEMIEIRDHVLLWIGNPAIVS